MTTGKAEATITTAALVTFASVAANRISHAEVPSGRFVASTCLAFAALGIVAGPAPDIGAGLAIATAGTAFVTMGLPLLSRLYPDSKKG